jgi:hypothetical protein
MAPVISRPLFRSYILLTPVRDLSMASVAASRHDTNTEPDEHDGPEKTQEADIEIAQRTGKEQSSGSKPEQRSDPRSWTTENYQMFDPDDYQDHGPPLRKGRPDGKEIKVSGQENKAECQKEKA